MKIYNVHIHTFTHRATPDGFLPLKMAHFVKTPWITKKLGLLLHYLIPFSDNDIFDRYAKYLIAGDKKDQMHVFENILRFYPEGTAFSILSMDMQYMGAGEVKQPFEEQLDRLTDLKEKYPDQVYPFIFVDPRRENSFDLVKKYIEKHDFAGIKMYPSLGYFPTDKRLYPIYEYAQQHQIPITVHCSRGGIHYHGEITDDMLKPCRLDLPDISDFDQRKKCNLFSHPSNYRHVLDDFPELKINFGHFGGQDDWQDKILNPKRETNDIFDINWVEEITQIVAKYKNAYTDISFTLHNEKFYPLLKIFLENPKLSEKILFGSDYYMLYFNKREKRFGLDIRGALGEEHFFQIANKNPKKFLNN